jgi:hypothetical protein
MIVKNQDRRLILLDKSDGKIYELDPNTDTVVPDALCIEYLGYGATDDYHYDVCRKRLEFLRFDPVIMKELKDDPEADKINIVTIGYLKSLQFETGKVIERRTKKV